jgi:hypothetical protein
MVLSSSIVILMDISIIRVVNEEKSLGTADPVELRLKEDNLLFGTKTLQSQASLPAEGLLQLANKPRKKHLKVKQATVAQHVMASTGNQPDKRLPLIDRLNKLQAELAASKEINRKASKTSVGSGSLGRRSSVSFRLSHIPESPSAADLSSSEASAVSAAVPKPPSMVSSSSQGAGSSSIQSTQRGAASACLSCTV